MTTRKPDAPALLPTSVNAPTVFKPTITDHTKMFAFELDGVTYEVPRAEIMSADMAERISAIQSGDFAPTLLWDVFGDRTTEVGAAIRQHLNLEQVNELMEAWSNSSSITAGESPASSD